MRNMPDVGMTTTEASRELLVTPEEVYKLIFSGELSGRPDSDGVVRISSDDLVEYKQSHPVSTS